MSLSVRLLTIFFALMFLSEGLVRMTLTSPAPAMPDEELGWVNKPYVKILHTSEGRARNRMNAMGFNDVDPIPDGRNLRILVLGDSVTEALQVPQSENFTSIAEDESACLDVYNAGRSGLSPIHYPIVLSRVARVFPPHLSVIVVSFRDLSDMRAGRYDVLRNPEDDSILSLHIKERPLNKLRVLLDPMLSRSALATYLMYRLKALLGKKAAIVNNAAANTAGPGRKPTAYDDERITEILEYLFDSMNSVVPIAILYNTRMEYGVNRIARVNPRSREFGQLVMRAAGAVGVRVLSTEPYMVASYRATGQPGVGFPNKDILSGHLNVLGHKAAALALNDTVKLAGLRCPQVDSLQAK